MIRLDVRALRLLVIAVIALAAVVGVSFAASAFAPTAVASTSELEAQRAATERAIQRIYATGIDQLRTTRSLKLAISDTQAAAIEQKYADQLKTLRHNALVAIGEAYGTGADQNAQYVAQTEQRLDASAAASAPPVLLAPRLFAIVERMGQLASQLTDQGIRDMTQSTPAGSPSSSPSTAPSAAPRAGTTPSPSPTR